MADSSKRRIAIVHYHLRRGGVTRVIEAAAEILQGLGHEVVVLSGEPLPAGQSKVPVRVVSGLDYRRTGNSVIAGSLAELLVREAGKHFGEEPDIWHFHNPTLAKNVLVPSVVRELAEGERRVVLQLHDFAEDGRPGNYSQQRSFFDSEASFDETLYPVAKQIHYATINRRDGAILTGAGVPEANVHVLANPVLRFETGTEPSERPFHQDRKFALYPSRGIRRKNLGELLLLAMAYRDEVHFATSLAPENAEWSETHELWRRTAAEMDLPVTFGIAEEGRHSYADIVGWSDFIVTTSVAEGFGLAFLEPWTAGKPVMGRDLPEVTRDFAENGVILPDLYERIDIPLAWVDEEKLKSEIDSVLGRSHLAYDVPLRRNASKVAWKALVKRGKVDFGVLDEKLQIDVLRHLAANPEDWSKIAVPPLPQLSTERIEEISAVILKTYSPAQYGEKLEVLYERALAGAAGKVSHIPPEKILARFLDPARLNLLRV